MLFWIPDYSSGSTPFRKNKARNALSPSGKANPGRPAALWIK